MSSSILIVTPYAESANNGNWRTAARWAALLRPEYEVIVRTPADPLHGADVLIGLHARRSHAVIRSWCERAVRGPCVLLLTGTDVYRDIPAGDPAALESLEMADRLVVLQPRAIGSVPAPYRSKTVVVYQSAERLPPFHKSSRMLRALFVGHLREEKDPVTFVRAAAAFDARKDVSFAMAGGARDPQLAAEVARLAATAPRLAMLNALSHAAARSRIRRSHVLVVPSRMEGGANVIVEAVMSGTAVLASDCDGNVGMLGEDYPGYFGVGDAAALARLLARCRDEPAFLQELTRRIAARSGEFEPATERAALLSLLDAIRKR